MKRLFRKIAITQTTNLYRNNNRCRKISTVYKDKKLKEVIWKLLIIIAIKSSYHSSIIIMVKLVRKF